MIGLKTVVLALTLTGVALAAVQLDTQKNYHGTTATDFKGILGQDNYVYIEFADVDLSTYDGQIKIRKSDTFVELSFAIILSGTSSTQFMVKAHLPSLSAADLGAYEVLEPTLSNPTVMFSFIVSELTEPIMIACLNDQVKIHVPQSIDGHIVKVLGKETTVGCEPQTVDIATNGNEITLDMVACSIAYFSNFKLVIKDPVNALFDVDDDLVTQMQCKKVGNILRIDNADVSADIAVDTSEVFEQTIEADLTLTLASDPTTSITSSTVGDAVSLTIMLDPLYTNDFDVFPMECTINDISILNMNCADYPMNQFEKIAVGHFQSNFSMFRPVVDGVPAESVTFSCNLFVCSLGDCPVTDCSGSRKRRSVLPKSIDLLKRGRRSFTNQIGTGDYTLGLVDDSEQQFETLHADLIAIHKETLKAYDLVCVILFIMGGIFVMVTATLVVIFTRPFMKPQRKVIYESPIYKPTAARLPPNEMDAPPTYTSSL